MKYTESYWVAAKQILFTRLGGEVDLEDVRRWTDSLHKAADQIGPDTRFKAFINLYGFKATNKEAHMEMRTVVPLLLAQYNFRAGYIDLFENADVELVKTNGSECIAVCHVHNDIGKIRLYQERFDKANERFFTDPAVAERWIEAFEL